MSESERIQHAWFGARWAGWVSSQFSTIWPFKQEQHATEEVDELKYRILLPNSFIDLVSSYWYEASFWTKIASTTVIGLGVLAVGVLIQAPVLLLSAYIMAAALFHVIFDSHEKNRRESADIHIAESRELTNDLAVLKKESSAINELMNRMTEELQQKKKLIDEQAEQLNALAQQLQKEGAQIPEALSDIRSAVVQRRELEQQVIARYQARSDDLNALSGSLDETLAAVQQVNGTVHTIGEALDGIRASKQSQARFFEEQRMRTQDAPQPLSVEIKPSNIVLEYSQKAALRRERLTNLKALFDAHESQIRQEGHVVISISA